MTLNPVGNIFEADTETRDALDRAILLAFTGSGRSGSKNGHYH